ncbi:MAG: hypothetical protein HYZ00_04115, partial [Candidatus Hydrogenedentes bacterium]|nr:hypothetical protein [Candidatus Hydrogenedentota bacterium]
MPEPNLTNPELQESLRALEGGDEASLMDATPLGVSALEDNAPLGPEGESGPLHENAGGAQAASLPVPVADVPAGPGGPGAPPGILEREDLYAHLMGERAQAQTDDIALDRDSVDELMAELDKVHARPAPEAAAGPAAEEGPLSQDMLDAIIAAASTEEAVVSENLAAAATTPAPDFDALTQKDLDHIIDKARELGLAIKGLEQGTVPETAPVMPASPRPRLRLNFAFRRPRLLERFTRKTMARLAAALLLGIGVGSGTYVYLTQTPGPESPVPVETSAPPEDLGTAIEQARELSTAGDYAGAVKLLEEPLAEAQEDPRRLDAEYVMMEARVKGFVFEADSPAYMQLHDDLDALVKEDPEHPRAPEALMWKASLYDLDGLH